MFNKVRNKLCRLVQEFFARIYYRKLRKKLKNHNFTILSSNCIGGILYHRFGEKFCSPTINLWMHERDFQKFCLNVKYYRECQLEFVYSEKKYPVANLGKGNMAIKIFFMHYKSQQEALDKWNERIKRIDEKNLYVIATDNEGMTEELLSKWKAMQCRNIVVFTAKKYQELDYTFLLEKYQGRTSVGKYVNDVNKWTGIRYVEKAFDFVNFFNT